MTYRCGAGRSVGLFWLWWCGGGGLLLAARQVTAAFQPRASPRRRDVFPRTVVAAFTKDTSPSVEALMRLLRDEGECEGVDALAIGFDDDGLRGLFATESFATGDYLLALPFASSVVVREQVTPANEDDDNDNGNKDDDNTTDEDAIAQGLAFLQIVSQARDELRPAWVSAYLECLPRLDDDDEATTPDRWSSEALERLPVPKLVQDSSRRGRLIDQAATEHGVPVRDLAWAVSMIRSRGFTGLQAGKSGRAVRERTVLLPLVDMINHAPPDTANASIQVVAAESDETSMYALQATAAIAAGEAVVVTYGTGWETSLELLDTYGFWADVNPNDGRIDWDMVDVDHLHDDDRPSDVSCPALKRADAFTQHLRKLRQTYEQ
jgi:hypothetical protein